LHTKYCSILLFDPVRQSLQFVWRGKSILHLVLWLFPVFPLIFFQIESHVDCSFGFVHLWILLVYWVHHACYFPRSHGFVTFPFWVLFFPGLLYSWLFFILFHLNYFLEYTVQCRLVDMNHLQLILVLESLFYSIEVKGQLY
jgi:hypothetical protein